ncbi:uncharacterized protein LOC116349821 [Contarinia nasturtii]|uniref:uncharacterized protein LOC116349038 n=1 Tax=Contarinia nasturtii TaxID=265458 RepID=UPI0012D3FF60|nr:uncharacterized protein LOC116349038 [Contarinia nasturtii]XP_031636151.1 uncharacterized protein LOC116349038 [Contarinia nasturtii]XP_031637282.1 uncharacterized protein LOC116349821 [Contarinia nasturtii]XP_031637283.1 uncharacterized protein LOC116349821 [Contarinia nasturtii]XP_031637284.1 uncharacterized protein LOC116349821 [Contarinia nasturtii]
MTPRPPELYDSDSEDSEYEGFMMSSDYDQYGNRIRKNNVTVYVDPKKDLANDLSTAIRYGRLNEFRSIWMEHRNRLDINQPLLDGSNYTPLMLACQERQLEIIKYFLFELKAETNANSNDMTALILACSGSPNLYADNSDVFPEEEENVRKICEWLIEHNAMVDKANLRRETPLMHAAQNGYTSVIELLLNNRATLEACDNEEKTSLFYAVNNDRYEATKTLIEAGALTDMRDIFGNTPKALAEARNIPRIIALFPPDPIVDYVPNTVYSYNTYMDHIPDAFPEKEAPAYSPDLYTMLSGMRAKQNEFKFYKSNIGLPEFLTVTDERLREIGIEFPYQRKRILFGLLRFHEKIWSQKSVPIPKLKNTSIQQYFEIFSNCLKQLVIIKSSLNFVEEHELFVENADISFESHELRQEVNQELEFLRKNALRLFQTMQKIEKKLAVPPPINICQNTIQELLKKNTFRQQLYWKFKLLGLGTVGLSIVTVAVIKFFVR